MSSLIDEIEARVDRCEDEIVASLIEAVRIPTPTPPGDNYAQIVEHFARELSALGYDARREDVPPEMFAARVGDRRSEFRGPRANLLARAPRTGRPQAVFYCHLDTMPARDQPGWTIDPFEPQVRDGWVWGRGTADSKAGAVAILWGLRVLRELGIQPAVDPVVALTTDEEVGVYSGLMHLADLGAFDDVDRFFSADGMAGSVSIGAQGGLTWTIRVRGRSVHSASSFLGVNPIEHAAVLLQELLATKRTVEERRGALALSPEMVAPGRTHVSPTLNVTMARAGIKHNVIPDLLVLEGDRRYLPEESHDVALAELHAAIDRACATDPDLHCTLEVLPQFPAFANDPSDPWVRRVAQLATRVRGTEVPLASLSGSTDVAYVAAETGIKVAIHGVARFAETRNHAADERCQITDMLAITKIVAGIAAGAA